MSTQTHAKTNGAYSTQAALKQYEHLREAVQDAAAQSRKNFDRLCKNTEQMIEESAEKIHDTTSQVRRTVRKNPWPVIGGAALGALLIGFVIGRTNQAKEPWQR